jgi:hypothetical protein
MNNETRDELAEKEGSSYHETSEAIVMAFKNGWDACLKNEGCGKLVKRFGEMVAEKQQWKEECERLAKVAEFWQNKWNEANPGWQPPKIDNL